MLTSRTKLKLKRSYNKERARRDVVTTVGFIRVSKRKLKPKYRWSKGKDKWGCHYKIWDKSAPVSLSYDLVRAERINGEPRHKFVLGFGSPASASKYVGEPRGVTLFWTRSFDRMGKHGLSKAQQFQIAEQLKRKGIPLPSVKECRAAKAKQIEWNAAYPDFSIAPERHDALIAFVKRRRQ
jgi:hypothetical protein